MPHSGVGKESRLLSLRKELHISDRALVDGLPRMSLWASRPIPGLLGK